MGLGWVGVGALHNHGWVGVRVLHNRVGVGVGVLLNKVATRSPPFLTNHHSYHRTHWMSLTLPLPKVCATQPSLLPALESAPTQPLYPR
jgi:hypothetical protein